MLGSFVREECNMIIARRAYQMISKNKVVIDITTNVSYTKHMATTSVQVLTCLPQCWVIGAGKGT